MDGMMGRIGEDPKSCVDQVTKPWGWWFLDMAVVG